MERLEDLDNVRVSAGEVKIISSDIFLQGYLLDFLLGGEYSHVDGIHFTEVEAIGS